MEEKHRLSAVYPEEMDNESLLPDICQFATVWVENFQNRDLNGYVLTDENFEKDCQSFGFDAESGFAEHAVSMGEGKEDEQILSDWRILEGCIDSMESIPALGSLIYRAWLNYAHTEEGRQCITGYDARQWFVIALSRLAVLCGNKEILRPYVICHMTVSLDGKATGGFLESPECAAAIDQYYRINREIKGDAFACGRVTMESSFTGGYRPELHARKVERQLRKDHFYHDPYEKMEYYAVSFDRRGRVGWSAEKIIDEDPGYNNAYILEVLCEDTPDEVLNYYREKKVSYLFAGEHELDLSLALRKLRERTGIRRLLLEGGSDINGAFEREDLIDELSLVMAPVLADGDSKPLMTDATMRAFELIEESTLPGGAVWLRYRRKRAA